MRMTELKRRLAVVLLLAPTSNIVIGCKSKALPDQELVRRFSEHEQVFNALSKSYEAGEVDCSSEDDPNICKIPNSESFISSLHGSDPVQDIYVKRNMGGDDGIWLPVQSYGVMSMSSSSRGYVYLKRPPLELIPDTLEEGRSGTHYRKLKGSWFLFSAQ